jgi:hypothetical protein
LAIQLLARIRSHFQVDLPLRRIFEAPTIAQLSGILLQDSAERARIERTAELLLSLSRLSEEEVDKQLAQSRPQIRRNEIK